MTSPLTDAFSVPLLDDARTEPTARFDFDHIPKLGPAHKGDRRGSLLPREGGRPGLIYAQIPLRYARKAEAAGWLPMFNQYRYTIIGPKGSIDMELMARGKIIPGLSSASTRCPCLFPFLVKADGTRVNLICEATGLDPTTGFALGTLAPPMEEHLDGSQETNLGVEVGSLAVDPECEDPQGEGGSPGEDAQPSSRHGRGNSRRS